MDGPDSPRSPEPAPSTRNFRTVAEARNAVRDAGGKWTAAVFFDALQCELDDATTPAAYEAIRNRSDVVTAFEKFKPDQIARLQGMFEAAQSRCMPHIEQEGDGEYV